MLFIILWNFYVSIKNSHEIGVFLIVTILSQLVLPLLPQLERQTYWNSKSTKYRQRYLIENIYVPDLPDISYSFNCLSLFRNASAFQLILFFSAGAQHSVFKILINFLSKFFIKNFTVISLVLALVSLTYLLHIILKEFNFKYSNKNNFLNYFILLALLFSSLMYLKLGLFVHRVLLCFICILTWYFDYYLHFKYPNLFKKSVYNRLAIFLAPIFSYIILEICFSVCGVNLISLLHPAFPFLWIVISFYVFCYFIFHDGFDLYGEEFYHSDEALRILSCYSHDGRLCRFSGRLYWIRNIFMNPRSF
jgi:hypothetical protein